MACPIRYNPKKGETKVAEDFYAIPEWALATNPGPSLGRPDPDMMVRVSEDDREAVKRTWHTLREELFTNGERFFMSMFQINRKFKDTFQFAHGKSLFDMVDIDYEKIEDPSDAWRRARPFGFAKETLLHPLKMTEERLTEHLQHFIKALDVAVTNIWKLDNYIASAFVNLGKLHQEQYKQQGVTSDLFRIFPSLMLHVLQKDLAMGESDLCAWRRFMWFLVDHIIYGFEHRDPDFSCALTNIL